MDVKTAQGQIQCGPEAQSFNSQRPHPSFKQVTSVSIPSYSLHISPSWGDCSGNPHTELWARSVSHQSINTSEPSIWFIILWIAQKSQKCRAALQELPHPGGPECCQSLWDSNRKSV